MEGNHGDFTRTRNDSRDRVADDDRLKYQMPLFSLPAAATARLPCATRPYSASRIFDTTQIRRRIAFSSAVDVTINVSTNHDSKLECQK